MALGSARRPGPHRLGTQFAFRLLPMGLFPALGLSGLLPDLMGPARDVFVTAGGI